jgi:hypothetical protein
VTRLDIHLPGLHRVSFRENVDLADVVEDKVDSIFQRFLLTALFFRNFLHIWDLLSAALTFGNDVAGRENGKPPCDEVAGVQPGQHRWSPFDVRRIPRGVHFRDTGYGGGIRDAVYPCCTLETAREKRHVHWSHLRRFPTTG